MKKVTFLAIFLVANFVLVPKSSATLVGYWDLNEGAGVVANDSSGFNNNGYFPSESPVWGQGKYGNALLFNGIPNAVVTVPYNDSLSLLNSFTIMAWVEPQSSGDRRIIEHYTAGGPSIGFILRPSEEPSFAGKWQVASSLGNIWSNELVQTDTWQHLAVTYDEVNLQLYINGVLDTAVPASGSLYDYHDPWIIGGTLNDPGAPNSYKGSIDEVRIYNHALSGDEIIRDMNFDSKAIPEPATMLLFGTGLVGAFLRKRDKI